VPLTSIASHGDTAAAAQPARRPFRDNPRLILAGIALFLAVLIAIIALANGSTRYSADFLSEFVLYGLLAADLTMLAALVFVLARNIVKLVVERRRGKTFARFRARLVALLLGMTVVPAVLVLAVGSELIRTSVDRWFNAPMDDMLKAANQIAGDYYHERQLLASDQAARLARVLGMFDLTATNAAAFRDRLATEVASQRVQIVDMYRRSDTSDLQALDPIVNAPGGAVPPGYTRQMADSIARETLQRGAPAQSIQSLGASGDLVHAADVVRSPLDGRITGVVVVTDYLTGDVAVRSRQMTRAYERYNQDRVLKRPLTGVYLSFFLMVTLMILVGATWMGLYLAKRITQPVQMLAAAAREIGAGHLDQHLELPRDDEFSDLTEAFNAMADDLASSRRKVEQSTIELEHQHQDVERRRRYIETILERITTGIISVEAGGTIATLNSAAARLLGVHRSAVGQPACTVFAREDLQPLADMLSVKTRTAEPAIRDLVLARGGEEAHLSVVATSLDWESDSAAGQILVLDDVTPLVRTQKVAAWREVARRLAHEIKNPLTPIQLSAERLRRHFGDAPAGAKALVDECTSTIVGEVESLKGLVDEFSQFARMPAPRAVPTNLHDLLNDTLGLYDGLFADVRIERRFIEPMPLVRLDPEQIRRVIINIVDNAVEAMERRGHLTIETQLDAANHCVRVVIADDGPGIPPGEREKLFLPYYSTKRRGSGLGLAIVRRIIAEHGGSIDVADHVPHGTRFTIELPA
jgi:two-component system nitrogen regulation sensor histidine kinase NtrY